MIQVKTTTRTYYLFHKTADFVMNPLIDENFDLRKELKLSVIQIFLKEKFQLVIKLWNLNLKIFGFMHQQILIIQRVIFWPFANFSLQTFFYPFNSNNGRFYPSGNISEVLKLLFCGYRAIVIFARIFIELKQLSNIW
jgi:hypothetical protein